MIPETITILDRRTDQPVEAVLHTDLDELRLIEVEIVWSPERLRGLRHLREQGVPKHQLPQHVHWNWALKAVQQAHLLAYRTLGIEADGKMHGLRMISLAGRLARLDPDKGKPLVYIDFLETAPWNAREFTDAPLSKGVGVRLMQAAVRVSGDEGFSGRVGLHALPQSEPFYAGACGMQALGPDPQYHDLEYFEFAANQAAEFLKK